MKKTIKVDKNGFVTLSDFADMLPVQQVKYYKITVLENGGFTIKFYDKNKKVLKPYVK